MTTKMPPTVQWFSRASQGYGGKGAKPSGLERHEITRRGSRVAVTAEVCFENFGLNHYTVSATAGGAKTSATYRDVVRGHEIRCELNGDTWRGTVDGHTVEISADGADLALPSFVARLWREPGRYIVLPEDAFPAYKPKVKGSIFPVLGLKPPGPRTITDRGIQSYKVGRATHEAQRLDHVGDDGEVLASSWWGDDGALVRYEQQGCVIDAVPEADALELKPKGARLGR